MTAHLRLTYDLNISSLSAKPIPEKSVFRLCVNFNFVTRFLNDWLNLNTNYRIPFCSKNKKTLKPFLMILPVRGTTSDVTVMWSIHIIFIRTNHI